MRMITWQDKTPKQEPRTVFDIADPFEAVNKWEDFIGFCVDRGATVWIDELDYYAGISINGHFSHYELIED